MNKKSQAPTQFSDNQNVQLEAVDQQIKPADSSNKESKSQSNESNSSEE